MMKHNSFILDNCIANTVPNFYLFNIQELTNYVQEAKCMIFRHQCQGIRHTKRHRSQNHSYYFCAPILSKIV